MEYSMTQIFKDDIRQHNTYGKYCCQIFDKATNNLILLLTGDTYEEVDEKIKEYIPNHITIREYKKKGEK